MITQFKLFEAITYPFEQMKDKYCIYTFTNKNGTKYYVSFQDGQMYYQTDTKGLDETNEFDIINVFTTLATIIYDYLQKYDKDVFIDNIPSKKERDVILRKVDNHTGKALNLSRAITNNRTKNMMIYLEKVLPKEYKIEVPFKTNVNMIHVYLEGASQAFESISSEPKVYDYVICAEDHGRLMPDEQMDSFLNSNIGRIIGIDQGYAVDKLITVCYENIPDETFNKYFFKRKNSVIGQGIRKFNRKDILYFSENISDIQRIIKQRMREKRFDL